MASRTLEAASRGRPQPRRRFASALAVGAAVALTLGIYGRAHDPTGRSLVTLFFTQTITLKVWLATAAVTLALFQGASALRIYGKLGRGTGPRWLRPAHRISGAAAFLLAIPVAYHCLWALGYQWHSGTRVLVHGTLGCFFFGALAAKVLVVRTRRMPSWALPVMGGTVFTALVVVWATSAVMVLPDAGPQDLMARRRAVERAILWVLIAGALVFAMLLAGVGSGLITKPARYSPLPPAPTSPSPLSS